MLKKILKGFLYGFGALMIVIVAVAFASSGDEEMNEEVVLEDEATSDEVKKASLGETVPLDGLEFTAHGISTATNVGGEYGENAQGEYLILDVSVKNNKNEAITTDSSFFKLVVDGKTYEANSMATSFANEDLEFFLTEVNPGIETRGNVVFDVPQEIANGENNFLQVQSGFWGTQTAQIELK